MRARFAALALLAALVGDGAGPGAAADETAVHPFVVIVNKARPETDIALHRLVRIYLGEMKFWENREAIRPVLPSPAVRRGFYASVLKLDPRDFDRWWKERVFRGENTFTPIPTLDESQAAQLVFASATAVAVVDPDQSATLGRVVKILTVDGKAYTDPAYRLRW
jgi:hypothetical protein